MYEIPLNPSRLKRLIRECKNQKIFPIFLIHHHTRDTANPVDRLVGELVDECKLYLGMMSEVEIQDCLAALPASFRMFIDRQNTVLPSDLLHEKIAIYYVAAVIHKDYFVIRDVLNPNLGRSSVLAEYPEIRDRLDDDGLLTLTPEFKLAEGGIFYKNHVLHYHQFLRRGFMSNPNFDFLGHFSRCFRMASDRVTFRIAVDHDRLMPREFYMNLAEHDYWFGPAFDPAAIDDPNSLGLTIHTRAPNSIFELTNHLERTEFFWSYRNRIKTFEVEELSRDGFPLDEFYLNRYVHSERDIDRCTFRHLDGAVKVYPKDVYPGRLAVNLPKETRTQKIKLFRVDGEIADADWTNLVSFFYRGNEMVVEYLDPEQFEAAFGEMVRDNQRRFSD